MPLRLLRLHAPDPAAAQRAFDSQFRRDAFGHWLHVAAAMLACFGAAGSNSIAELAALPLVALLFIRTLNIWRMWGTVLAQPLTWAVLAWSGWVLLSLLWSPDPVQGFREFGVARFAIFLPAFWPVIDRRRWLIAALAAGFLAGNVGQMLDFGRAAGRFSGWWDPVVGGSLLTAALGLHLPAAVMGRGRERAVALAAAGLTGLGILATGTRGAWIAAALLMMTVALVAAWRGVRGWRVAQRAALRNPDAAHPAVEAPRRLSPRFALLGLGVAIAALIAGAVMLGPAIVKRAQAARAEVVKAIQSGDYSTDTGARLLMWQWAARARMEHPVAGVGAGGFRPWTLQRMREERAAGKSGVEARATEGSGLEARSTEESIHAHAHSAYLHAAATTGLIGLALGAAALLLAFRGGLESIRPGTYDAAPVFAIAGLMLAGLFDTVQVNAQTALLLGVLIGLCGMSRPLPHPPAG